MLKTVCLCSNFGCRFRKFSIIRIHPVIEFRSCGCLEDLMSEFSHRFRLSRVLNFALTIALGLMVVTLIACGGSSSKAASPVVTVAITPKTPTLSVNAAQTFAATVTGSTNQAVTWSVTEANGGSINSTGKYTAAAQAGTYHVVATSQASSTAFDTATVTVTAPVTAPVPNFTSSAPATALESTLYTYAPITATDPAGGNVTFTLTSGPDGATLSGSTLTWTPTAAQSRTDNAFTVTATSSEGGINTQSWTVNPNGTIYGSQIDNYWGANGKTTKADDLSGYTFSAVLPNGDTITGTGNSNGTFTIAGVPGGNFWLRFIDPSGFSSNFWTNSSTFDLGADYTGRDMSAVTCDGSTELDLTNLTGLDSLSTDDSYLDTTIPNQGNYGFVGGAYLPAGSPSSLAGPVAMNASCPVDPTSGDELYLTQDEQPTGPGDYLSTAGPSQAFPGLAAPGSSATEVTGNLATANPQLLDLQIQGADWAADITNNVGSVVGTPNSLDVSVAVQPFVSDRYALGSLSLVDLSWNSGMTSNQDFGSIGYNNPYPSSWLPVYSGSAEASLVDGNGDWVVNSFATTTAPASGFGPLMSAIQNPKMNGQPLFTAAQSDTDAVTLSWTAPTGLNAAGYEIFYYCVDSSCPASSSGYLYTPSTSITLPSGFLEVGYHYEFDIGAIADSVANYNSSPYRSGYPQAYADVVSAPLYINAASGQIRRQGAIAKAKTASAQVARTKYGSFLVTAKGNKPLDVKARMLARQYQRSLMASKAVK